MMFRMNGNSDCAASAFAEASFSCANKVNTVNLGAIIVASIIISLRRLCRVVNLRANVAEMNMAVRTAA